MKKIFIFLTFFWTNYALSADVTVEMLNKLNNEYMVFSKKIVRVNIGDTVQWKATDKGHNVEFIKNAIPEGVENFKSKYNIDVEYKFTIPGIYAYWCTPHKSMGMIGFIVVDDDKSNLKMIHNINYFGRSKKVAKLLIDQL